MLVRSQKKFKRPLIVLLNKIDFKSENPHDFVSQTDLQQSLADLDATAVLPVSARTGEGVKEYLKVLRDLLPEADALYPEEDLTDMNMREIAAELIQEQLFLLLGDELPYSCAVEVVKYVEPVEGQKKTEIQVNIHVERESQKPILIGKGGAKIKEIGIQARKRIEEVLDAPVILKLFVKINPAWTENEKRMRELGYLLPRKK
jgi:GTP-binding protein Era